MAEYKCGDCFHAELCEKSEMLVGFSKGNYAYCSMFLNSANVAPVVHGHWETNSDRPDTLICSVCKCGFDMWKHDPHNFCPNCGAKMDEVNE